MQHFQRAISRFCRAQDEAVDPPTAEEIREIVRETVRHEQEREREELLVLFRRVVREEVTAIS